MMKEADHEEHEGREGILPIPRVNGCRGGSVPREMAARLMRTLGGKVYDRRADGAGAVV